MTFFSMIINLFTQLMDIILHLDQHLLSWIEFFGPWIYVILFLIYFCETGLVVAAFLPGDSLLFALGAIAALPNSPLNLVVLFVLLSIAAIIGDSVNYSIGKFLGPKIFNEKKIKFLNQNHLHKTKIFYEKHGGKTILWSRFIPIVRTFTPLVAGIGLMNYKKFLAYNIFGGLFWISSLLTLGHLFGNLPVVQKNFHFIIFGIIFISFLPVCIEFYRTKIKTS